MKKICIRSNEYISPISWTMQKNVSFIWNDTTSKIYPYHKFFLISKLTTISYNVSCVLKKSSLSTVLKDLFVTPLKIFAEIKCITILLTVKII